MKFKKTKTIKFLPALLWMAVVFYLSHQPAEVSSNLSSGLLEKIMNKIQTMTSSTAVQTYHGLFRKSAHVGAYFILSLLLMYGFKNNKRVNKYLVTLLIGFGFSVSDEFHQLFIKGRSGQISDVLIDLSGVVLALIIIKTGCMFWHKKNK